MVFAILRALNRAIRRDLASFQSCKVNNFFLFVALLIWGALVSGVKPVSSYPFLLMLGFLLLFPLSSDPLSKIPPVRLASWPLARGQRLALRITSLALSPVLWLAVFIMLKTSPALALFFLGAVLAIQACIVWGSRLVQRAPRWNPWRLVPPLPGQLGQLVRKDIRQMLSVLDFYVALLLSLSGCIYRFLNPHPDSDAFPILAILVSLALSTYAQCLFALDGASGAARYSLLPLPGWQILAAKDLGYLTMVFVLVLPLSPIAGLTFALVALAIGHFPSVLLNLPQQRWRFTSGRLPFGAAQALVGVALAFAGRQKGAGFLLLAAALYLLSLYLFRAGFCRRDR